MTREEAREFLMDISYKLGNMAVEYLSEKDGEKMRDAIDVLEQEPFIDKPCVSSGVCEHDKQKVLDKIRAEIETKYEQCDICEYFEDYDYEENDISEYRPIGNIADILQIIDKYKAESERT
jgi:hypothetical protein